MMVNAHKSFENILSVNEDPMFSKIIGCYLEDCGFTVFLANNREEALKFFRRIRPDLILSDLKMSTVTGLELLKTVKSESPETPFIVISNEGATSEVSEALQLGAWDCIVKPFSKTLLEHVVCKALERRRLILENSKQRTELENKNCALLGSLAELDEDKTAGKRVQKLLLPKSDIHNKDYTLSYKVIPSLYLSGDFVDYFEIDKDKIGFYIADVSGHGASAAFVTILLKGLVEQMLKNYHQNADDMILHPDKVLKRISDDVLNAKLGKYITMIYCVLDLKSNSLQYSVGGHYPSPMIWDGNIATFLTGSGFAVGIFKDAEYENYCCNLPSQFTMAMFSDGIFEAMSGDTLKEKQKTLLSLMNESHSSNIEELLPPLGINDTKTFTDDITLLLMNKMSLDHKLSSENQEGDKNE